MRILALAFSDTAGSPSRWARALAEAGHNVTLLIEAEHPFKYTTPTNVEIVLQRWSNGNRPLCHRVTRIFEIAEGHDVALAMDHPFYWEAARELGIPAHFHAFGTAGHEADSIPPGATGDTIELCTSGYEWLPMPVYPNDYPLPNKPTADVFHAPTQPHLKGTALIKKACKLANLRLDRPNGRLPHQKALERKARARVHACQVYDGTNPRVNAYGVSGLEAFAMGVPVVGSPSPQVEAHHTRFLGHPDERPYLMCGTDPAAVAGDLLAAATTKRAELVERAHAYIAERHDPAQGAAEMLERLVGA